MPFAMHAKRKGTSLIFADQRDDFQDRQRPEGEITKKQHRRKYAKAKLVQAESEENSGTSDRELSTHKVEHSSTHPSAVDLSINGMKVSMEVDTGSAVTIISESNQVLSQ